MFPIHSAAVKIDFRNEQGKVETITLSSPKHHDNIQVRAIAAISRGNPKNLLSVQYGYLDSEGTYLTRRQAWVAAEANGQIRFQGTHGSRDFGLECYNLHGPTVTEHERKRWRRYQDAATLALDAGLFDASRRGTRTGRNSLVIHLLMCSTGKTVIPTVTEERDGIQLAVGVLTNDNQILTYVDPDVDDSAVIGCIIERLMQISGTRDVRVDGKPIVQPAFAF